MLLFYEHLQVIKENIHIFRVIDCLNTIYDKQNEKDYLYHYSEFLHNQDFEENILRNCLCIIGLGNFR